MQVATVRQQQLGEARPVEATDFGAHKPRPSHAMGRGLHTRKWGHFGRWKSVRSEGMPWLHG